MKRILSALAALVLLAQSALAQGSAQAPNLFWATPLSGTGFLTLRAIGWPIFPTRQAAQDDETGAAVTATSISLSEKTSLCSWRRAVKTPAFSTC